MINREVPVHLVDVRYQDENTKEKLVFEFSDGSSMLKDVTLSTDGNIVQLSKSETSKTFIQPKSVCSRETEFLIMDNIEFFASILGSAKQEKILSNIIFLTEFSIDILSDYRLFECIFRSHFFISEPKSIRRDTSIPSKLERCCFLSSEVFEDYKLTNMSIVDCVFYEFSLHFLEIYELDLSNNIFFYIEVCEVNILTTFNFDKCQFFSYFYDLDSMVLTKKTCAISFKEAVFFDKVYLNKGMEKKESQNKLCFDGAVFNDDFVSENIHFLNDISFKGTVFKGKAKFNSTKFSMCSLLSSTFNDTADFCNTEFHKNVSFEKSSFNNVAVFDYAKFEKEPNFTYTTFYDTAVFRETEFKGGINLSTVNLRDKGNLNFFYKDFDAKVKDNSKDCPKDKKHELQETYRIIKNEYQKKNDTINAVNLYKKECECHYQSLDWSWKDSFNKLILCFEKHTSSYGTNALKAIAWLFVINLLIFVCYVGFETGLTLNSNSYTWNGLGHSIEGVFKTLIPSVISGEPSVYKYAWIKVLHFVINSVLIYEIIKSFRKYSRKL